jgi:bacterioferritin (cytochrome b1)
VSGDQMDTDEVLRTMDEALTLQGRSLMALTLLAGSMRGVLGTALKPTLRDFVAAELHDTYLLVEKLSSLGGTPSFDVDKVEISRDPAEALEQLLVQEREGVAALHAIIPHTGQQPHSEALEHLLEHMIMRKQQQVDFLVHAAES